MKLKAFLAVSLPLLTMAQSPAMADDLSMSDTGNWLRSSIASLKQPTAKPKAAATKVCHALPDAPVVQNSNIRAFVPNRYLPHERDLKALQARLDNSRYNSTGMRQLSGEVSSQYASSSPYDAYRSAMSDPQSMPARLSQAPQRAGVSRSPRLVPGQAPILPEQLSAASNIKPFIPEPPQPQPAARPQFPITMPVSGMAPTQPYAGQPVSAAYEPSPISVQEQRLLERLMAQNRPTATMDSHGDIYGTTPDNPNFGTGPSPFPVNLMPGNAMQTLNQARRRAPVPQARFGSWHNSASASALPESGFHSYLHHRQPRLFSYVASPPPSAERRTTPRRTTAHSPSHTTTAHNIKPAPHTLAQSALASKPLMVATYPTYIGPHGLSY